MEKKMSRGDFMKASAAMAVVLVTGDLPSAIAQELKPIQLLPP
jgi:hypothetical protein